MKVPENATEFYCNWNQITLGDLDSGDRNLIKFTEAYAEHITKIQFNALSKIDKIVESDIPVPKFILALLQIKKIVKSTGHFGKFS